MHLKPRFNIIPYLFLSFVESESAQHKKCIPYKFPTGLK